MKPAIVLAVFLCASSIWAQDSDNPFSVRHLYTDCQDLFAGGPHTASQKVNDDIALGFFEGLIMGLNWSSDFTVVDKSQRTEVLMHSFANFVSKVPEGLDSNRAQMVAMVAWLHDGLIRRTTKEEHDLREKTWLSLEDKINSGSRVP